MIAMLLVLCIVFSMCSTVWATEVRADEDAVTTGAIKSGTVSQMLADRVNTMASRTGESLTVAEVKELNDFKEDVQWKIGKSR